MRFEFVSKKLLAIVCLTTLTLIHVFGVSAKAAVAKAVSTTQTDLSLPARLIIPKIKVNAAIETVGLTSEGAVGVPKKPVDVAWLNVWPRPGEVGNAIITGHFGWWNNSPATFDNLNKLRVGDKIYVEDKDKTIITFVVRNLKAYKDKEDYSSVFYSSDNKAHLNLITCNGSWNKKTQRYSKRLVVFAYKE